MKTIKLLLPLALLFFSISGNAQDKTAPVKGDKQSSLPTELPKKESLNLSIDQQRTHREIIKRYAEKVRDVRKSVLTPQEKKSKLEVLDLEKEAELKVLLTPEQYKIHLASKAARRSEMIDMRRKNAVPSSVKSK